MHRFAGFAVILGLLATLATPSLRGDALHLKSGGELRGELVNPPVGRPKTAALAPITIRTLSGAVVTVDADEVAQVVRRRPLLEEYETRRRTTPQTVEAQWELSEWCRQNALPKQRVAHLEQIVALEPGHTPARRGLGHVRHEGQWMTPEAMMTARGYVKHKGRYVLPQELELIEEEERENEAERAWFRKVRLWAGWLSSDQPERLAEGLNELRAIRDEDAVPALVRTFHDDANEQKRLLFIDILTRIGSSKALVPLVKQSLHDDSRLVRSASIRGVRGNDVDEALPMYLRALKNEANLIVNRAADALAELGDKSVVPRLIDALITRHRYKVMVPDTSISFGSDGSMSGGQVPLPPDVAAALATGQLPQGVQVNVVGQPQRMKRVTIQKDEQNPSVLTALSALTGENFGYDEASWRKWHIASQSGNLKPRKNAKSTRASASK